MATRAIECIERRAMGWAVQIMWSRIQLVEYNQKYISCYILGITNLLAKHLHNNK